MAKKDKEVSKEQIEAHQKSPCSTGKCNVCDYLKNQSTKISTGKISKLMIWPSRTINLGNFNSVKLDAGIEFVFETPISFDSPEVKLALASARKVIREEWLEQMKPYLKKKVEVKQ